MENTSNLIAIADNLPAFKSKELNAATKTIFNAVHKYNSTAAETRKTVAVVLARVERNKTYAEDGFKSLAEYAAEIGLDKSLTHKLENSGRLLDSEDEQIRDFAAQTDYSKLAILASAPVGDLKAAIESGDLTPDATQAQVKAWKSDNTAKNTPAKVLKNYAVHGVIFTPTGSTMFDYESIAIEAIPELDGFEMVKRPVPSTYEGDDVFMIGFSESTGSMARIRAIKVKAAPKSKKPATMNLKAFTNEQLKALMEEYERRQAEEEEGE